MGLLYDEVLLVTDEVRGLLLQITRISLTEILRSRLISKRLAIASRSELEAEMLFLCKNFRKLIF